MIKTLSTIRISHIFHLSGIVSKLLITYCCGLLLGACGLLSCGTADTPLDADTRKAIDSISEAQIKIAKIELDTLCQQRRIKELPRLVDSIRQVRQREIEEQLKTVPK